MILRRIGNKKRLSQKIISFFPNHDIYIEPFFGAGGIFFSKPLAKYNIVNDKDEEIFNLFKVLIERKEELYNLVNNMPIHESLLKYWNKNQETDPVFKAARFLLLSNFTYLGMPETIKLGVGNCKNILLDNFDRTYDMLRHVRFSNRDFRDFFNQINLRNKTSEKTFIYCDPPYVRTTNNYNHSFTQKDIIDLFNILTEEGSKFHGSKFAVSEFKSDFILDIVNKYKLNVIDIGERRNLGNRRIEILITNYTTNQTIFDGIE